MNFPSQQAELYLFFHYDSNCHALVLTRHRDGVNFREENVENSCHINFLLVVVLSVWSFNLSMRIYDNFVPNLADPDISNLTNLPWHGYCKPSVNHAQSLRGVIELNVHQRKEGECKDVAYMPRVDSRSGAP